MRNELKITMPPYKILYSLAFILLLSLVRGISYTDEIGIALESPIALLAVVFCSDTYMTERQNKRWEVYHLYSFRNQTKSILLRLFLQIIYLIGLSIVGYGLFYWQKPISEFCRTSAPVAFAMFLPAITGTIWLWSVFSMTLCNLCKNIWIGIAGSLLLWLSLISKAGAKLLGQWNVFSYTFRDINRANDWGFLLGTAISIVLAACLTAAIPFITKKRG